MLWLPLLFLGLVVAAGRRSGGSPASSVPNGSVYRPEDGRIVTPNGDTVDVPRGDPPARALVPLTPPAGPPPLKQPPGATGNLPDITRPLGRAGFDPERAAHLAPRVLGALRRGPGQFPKPLLVDFQRAADLEPADGVYGPRTAGALEYFGSKTGQPAKVPAPWTTDKRIIRYAI